MMLLWIHVSIQGRGNNKCFLELAVPLDNCLHLCKREVSHTCVEGKRSCCFPINSVTCFTIHQCNTGVRCSFSDPNLKNYVLGKVVLFKV